MSNFSTNTIPPGDLTLLGTSVSARTVVDKIVFSMHCRPRVRDILFSGRKWDIFVWLVSLNVFWEILSAFEEWWGEIF